MTINKNLLNINTLAVLGAADVLHPVWLFIGRIEPSSKIRSGYDLQANIEKIYVSWDTQFPLI